MLSATDHPHHVQCSWVASKPPVHMILSTSASGDIEDAFTEDNCVLFTRPDADDEASQGDARQSPAPCTVSVRCAPTSACGVQRVSLVSEARIFEAYGSRGEYVATRKCILLEDVEGTRLFKGDVCFPRPLAQFSLKFSGWKGDQLWVYGIQLTHCALQQPAAHPPPALGQFLQSVFCQQQPDKSNTADPSSTTGAGDPLSASLGHRSPTGGPDTVAVLRLLEGCIAREVAQMEERLWERVSRRMDQMEERLLKALQGRPHKDDTK